MAIVSCRQQETSTDDAFFERQNAAHDGDYLATYPLHNPDSCIIRLKAEVPEQLQPWACFSLWYRLPRNSPERSFRLLELYDTHYPHDTVFAFTQLVRGEFMVELRHRDSARVFLNDARRRYLALGRPLDASDADYLMARCYSQENNLPKALESYFGVLELLNRHDTAFSHRHAFLYMDIATAYRRSKDLLQEMFWLHKAWNADFSQLDKAWDYQVKIAARMASAYAVNNPDSSLIMARLAVDIFKENSDAPVPSRLQYYLCLAHFKKGDCAAALPLCRDAYDRNNAQQDVFWSSQLAQALGESYFCLGRLDSAEWFIRQAIASPDTGNLTGVHKRLADIYTQRGDYKAALSEVIIAYELNQRLFAAERARALSEFEARFEAARKERLITELEAQQKIRQQRDLLIILSFLTAIGLLAGLLWRQRNRRRFLEQSNELLQQKKALAEVREQLKIQELEHSQFLLKNTQAELNTTAELLTLKNQLIEELEMRLHRRNLAPLDVDAPDSSENPNLHGLKILTEADWSRFRERFDRQMPGFMTGLKAMHPSLTNAEIRLFLLMKLGFDTLEISEALGISKESVWRSRHRLSKRLGLPETADLNQFVQGF
ncbi:MAG: phage tail tape measure protein [Saprospiraceae bacterium]|nr:phage tail tape measure protein [Saprospiraceae bacterium]